MTEEQLSLGLQVDKAQALRDKWCSKISGYKKEYDKWMKRGDKIVDRYRNDQATTGDESARIRRYALLWSNIQTLGPAIYARPPKPEVTRRYYDKDPTARLASATLERALMYEMDVTGFHAEVLGCRDDYLLVGRGTLWQRYEPVFEDVAEDSDGGPNDQTLPDTGETNGNPQPGVEAIGANGGPPLQQRVIGENAPTDYVHWKDFLHGPAQTWKQVPWVGRKLLLDKASVDARWPAKPGQPALSTLLSFTHKQERDDDKKRQTTQIIGNLALIYEIWDKTTFKVAWYSEDLKTSVIEEIDDPLGLDNFFPCPEPLYATRTTDTLEPVPDYIFYRDQASEIDILTQRITLLMKSLAVRGVYDSSNQKLADLLNERPENFMLPVDNWAAFAEKGGFQGTTSFVPIAQIAEVVSGLQTARGQFIQDVYQITGISDIIRGQGDPNETAAAQQLKGQFGNMRLNSRRDAINQFVCEALRIKAQVMAEHFDQSTLRQISGFDQMTEVVSAAQTQGANVDALWQQVYALLKNDPMRLTKLDVETDSMIQADQIQQQQSRTQFLAAVGGFLKQALEAVQTAPQLAPLMGQMLAFGVRGFNIGRELEGVIDQAIDQINKLAANPPPQPPNPEVVCAQAEVSKAQTDQQTKTAEGNLALAKQQQDAIQQRHEFDENMRLQILELVLKYGAMSVMQASAALPSTDKGVLNGP